MNSRRRGGDCKFAAFNSNKCADKLTPKARSIAASLAASPLRRAMPTALRAGCALAALMSTPAWAVDFDTGNPDLKIRFDNTVKYSAAYRLYDPSAALSNDPTRTNGFDDGDRNFKKGFVSNRTDLLSEFEASYKDYGIRVSGAAWYDSIYNQHNNNNSPNTSNNINTPYNSFNEDTRRIMGRNAELLDAFVSGRNLIADMPLTLRVGRHAQQWGESIFFGGNGVAGGMGPVDLVKMISVPNSTFRETIRPVGQVSGNLQVNPYLSFGAYWQWEWAASRLPAAGSFLATSDNLPIGGESLWITTIGNGIYYAQRQPDTKPGGLGQFGVQAKFRIPGLEPEFGLYALRFDGKTAATTYSNISVNPGTNPTIGTTATGLAMRRAGYYRWVYPEDIQLYGASVNHSFGEVNVGIEGSIRRNSPLASIPQSATGTAWDNADGGKNALFAVGDTAHLNISTMWDIGRNPISEEASFVGEIAMNERLQVQRNVAALDPNSEAFAMGMRMVVTPTYRQVYPGLDVSVPIGLGWYPKGKSSSIAPFGPARGGDFNAGIKGAYLGVWNYSINYTHYIGVAEPYLNGISGQNYQNFGQPLADRDFIAVSFSRTF